MFASFLTEGFRPSDSLHAPSLAASPAAWLARALAALGIGADRFMRQVSASGPLDCCDLSGERCAVEHMKEKQVGAANGFDESRRIRWYRRIVRPSKQFVSYDRGAGPQPFNDRPQPLALVRDPVGKEPGTKILLHSGIEPIDAPAWVIIPPRVECVD